MNGHSTPRSVARRALLGTALLVAAAVLAPLAIPLAAQPIPVRWDSLGGDLDRISNDVVARSAVYGDTLFAVVGSDVFRLTPEEDTFGAPIATSGTRPNRVLTITDEGHLVSGRGRIVYSTNGGVTWRQTNDIESVDGVYQTRHPANAGRALAPGRTGTLWTSEDGTFWEPLYDFGSTGFRSVLAAYDLLGGDDPSASWAGRLLTSFPGVVRYSDDGGQTWTDATGIGSLGVNEFAEGPDGTVYARASTYLLRSDNGGAAWRIVFELVEEDWGLIPNGFISALAVGPDGTVWVGTSGAGDRFDKRGTMLYSTDGGATWAEAAEGYSVAEQVNALAFDGRGRLVAATDEGVWRTAEAAVVSAEDAAVPEAAGMTLEAAYPNPTDGSVTVPLVLAAPVAVRVTVYDVLGREVAVLTDGTLAAGRHALMLDTAGLAPGVYVVQAASGVVETAQRITVAR